MRSRRKIFGSVFPVNHKGILGVIVLLAISYALAATETSESAGAGTSYYEGVQSITKASPQTVSEPAGNEPEQDNSEQAPLWRVVRMRVTAYCPCPKCCGKYSDGQTASGRKIRQGDTFVAADKRHSFGTAMIVPGYNNSKPVKVLDRGGAIRGNRLDVFFDSHRKARKWGVRNLLVKVRAG